MISLLLEFAFSETKNFYMFVPWGHNQRRGTFQSSSTRNLPLEVDNEWTIGHDSDCNENYCTRVSVNCMTLTKMQMLKYIVE